MVYPFRVGVKIIEKEVGNKTHPKFSMPFIQ